jgi:hypothetical protein
MKLTSQESKEATGAVPTDKPQGPEYPWGLGLHLDDEVLGKLGMGLPEVGKTLMVQARVKVTGAMSNQIDGGKEQRTAQLQIVDMGIGTDEGEGTDAAAKLYDAK